MRLVRNSLELSASQLAAHATNGVVYVNALDSDLEIVDATTLIGGVSVTGVSASDEICIEVEDGALDIGSTILANNDIFLEADGDVILGASVIGGTSLPNVGITSVNGDIVDAGGNIDAVNLALSAGDDIGVDSTGAASPIDFDADSLAASAGGDINLNKMGGGNLSVLDHTVKSGTIVGITGGGDLDLDAGDGLIVIRSGGEIDGLEIAASQLAVSAAEGDVTINDIDSTDLEIVEATTLLGGAVDGVTAGGDINLATDGELTVTTNLEADGDICLDVDELDLRAGIESTGGNDIAVRSVGDILLGNGADRTLVSNGGTISLEAGGNIVNRNGDNLDIDADDGLVILTGGRFVGQNVAGAALQISASQLAASSSMNGDVAVEAIGPSDLEIVEATTLKGGVVVTGVEADNNVSLTVENGSLNIQEDILAGRDLILEANDDVTVAARVKTGRDEAIHITAVNGDIINGGGRIEGHDLGLSAAGDIGVDSSGAASPIVVDVTALAAEAGNDINLQAVGGVRISDIFGIDGVQGGATWTLPRTPESSSSRTPFG
ncbi:MAG: hypothetical protein KC800_00785 [Candidatus Eremiobacteraeota bacterium]|nr:hypothetical protein [Candidatus Eremiobacteraeota bacterium]